MTRALSSPKTLELTDRVLASDATQHALHHVASSPELRNAVARQTTGLAEEVVGGVRASAARLDDRAERVVRRPPRTEQPKFGGIVTRAIALATDAALTTVLFMSVVGIASLVASLVGGLRPEWLVGALLASGWILIAGTYFVLFWSSAGQTPGMRLLHLRVLGPTDAPPSLGRSLVRLVGLVLAIVPLFAGFLPILFTERRRGYPTCSREPSSCTRTGTLESSARRNRPERALRRADGDHSRGAAGRDRRGRRRAALVLDRRARAPRRLRGRRDVYLGTRTGAAPVAEPAGGRQLRVRGTTPPARAERARHANRDPRPRPLGVVDGGRARAEPGRDGAPAPPAAGLPVLARAHYRVRALRRRAARGHDGDESRARRLPVRRRRSPVLDRRHRDRRPGDPASAGRHDARIRRARPTGRRSTGRRHGARLPQAEADRRDEARQRLHRPRARRRWSRPRRAAIRRQAAASRSGSTRPTVPDALHGRPASGRRAEEPRGRADDVPAELLPYRKITDPPGARQLDHEHVGITPIVQT